MHPRTEIHPTGRDSPAAALPLRSRPAPEPASASPNVPEAVPALLPGGGDACLTHAAYTVRRNPGNLRAHVGRILLAYRLQDSAATAAAFADLAVVLGTRGVALRRTLAGRVGSVLSGAQRATVGALAGRCPAVAECEGLPGTVLTPPAKLAPVVVRVRTAGPAGTAEPVAFGSEGGFDAS